MLSMGKQKHCITLAKFPFMAESHLDDLITSNNVCVVPSCILLSMPLSVQSTSGKYTPLLTCRKEGELGRVDNSTIGVMYVWTIKCDGSRQCHDHVTNLWYGIILFDK